MKTLAQLIAELQSIAEPEKVIVVSYAGNGWFYFHNDKERESENLDYLDNQQINEMKEQGFSRAICI